MRKFGRRVIGILLFLLFIANVGECIFELFHQDIFFNESPPYIDSKIMGDRVATIFWLVLSLFCAILMFVWAFLPIEERK